MPQDVDIQTVNWLGQRTAEWLNVLQEYEKWVMGVYYSILLGLSPWISMVTLYMWTSIIGILLSGKISYIYTAVSMWLLVALVEYLYKAQILQRYLGGAFDKIGDILYKSADQVQQRTGYKPLELTDICYYVSVLEYQVLSLQDRLSTIRYQNALRYLVIVALIYVAVSLLGLVFSDKSIAYIILVGPLLLPVLHHYHIIGRAYDSVASTSGPIHRSLDRLKHNRVYESNLRPAVNAIVNVVGGWYDKYQQAVELDDTYMKGSPAASRMFRPSQSSQQQYQGRPSNVSQNSSTADSFRDIFTRGDPLQQQTPISNKNVANAYDDRRSSNYSFLSPMHWIDQFLQNSPAAVGIGNGKEGGTRHSDRPDAQGGSGQLDENDGSGNQLNKPSSSSSQQQQRQGNLGDLKQRRPSKPKGNESDEYDMIDSSDFKSNVNNMKKNT
ncbi:hypothetical protein MIR68_005425 [Amoeboaphelidium protococcarum]|nr:hypothetical protein MIR68_005425 [Amoeboaphelidium protococcarum]